MTQTDLFKGYGQPEPFAPPKQQSDVTPDSIRAKLLARLSELRTADAIPWNVTKPHHW